jgi:hypothetical protein
VDSGTKQLSLSQKRYLTDHGGQGTSLEVPPHTGGSVSLLSSHSLLSSRLGRAIARPWYRRGCSSTAGSSSGLSSCWRGPGRTGARGMHKLSLHLEACVRSLPKAGTWRCCSGRGRGGVRGMLTRALPPLGLGTWRCWHGRVSTAARGPSGRVTSPLCVGNWRRCGGRDSMAARGMNSRVHTLQ